MRKHLLGTAPVVAIMTALLWLLAAPFAHAQYPGPQGPIMFSSNCSASPQFGLAYLCFDTTKNAFYNWSSGTFAPAIMYGRLSRHRQVTQTAQRTTCRPAV